MNAPSRRRAVVVVDVAAVEEHPVLDRDRVQVAGAHADEGVARAEGWRPRSTSRLAVGALAGASRAAARTGTGSSSRSAARRRSRTARRRRGARAGRCRPPARRSSRPAGRRSSRARRARSPGRARSGRRACSPAARARRTARRAPPGRSRLAPCLWGDCRDGGRRARGISRNGDRGLPRTGSAPETRCPRWRAAIASWHEDAPSFTSGLVRADRVRARVRDVLRRPRAHRGQGRQTRSRTRSTSCTSSASSTSTGRTRSRGSSSASTRSSTPSTRCTSGATGRC